jgi:hypothetical protein
MVHDGLKEKLMTTAFATDERGYGNGVKDVTATANGNGLFSATLLL